MLSVKHYLISRNFMSKAFIDTSARVSIDHSNRENEYIIMVS